MSLFSSKKREFEIVSSSFVKGEGSSFLVSKDGKLPKKGDKVTLYDIDKDKRSKTYKKQVNAAEYKVKKSEEVKNKQGKEFYNITVE